MLNHLLDLPDDLMLSDHEVGVLEEATRDEAAHRLCNNSQLLWEALGPDALPRDERLSRDLERELAFCIVHDRYEKLGRMLAGMALSYAYRSAESEINDDWAAYIRLTAQEEE
tara:strand:+ start:961 stop:1299 length:339 start_codon:yes stop_codon:yes gene_type:complete